MAIRLADFGLVILIWITQLIVYPSFTYFSPENLYAWHQKYTAAITIIVMPLMIGQLVLHGYQIYNEMNWLRVVALVLILLAWANTFFYAVPLHNQISESNDALKAANSLIRINWYRTVLWSLTFLLGLLDHIRN